MTLEYISKCYKESTANGYDDLSRELEEKIEWVVCYIEKEFPQIKD